MEFLYYLVFFSLAFCVSVILYLLSYLGIWRTHDLDKLSAYECGFVPFEDSRRDFDVQFYLVAILFLIFDLEIAFFFPWILALQSLDFFGYITMMGFLLVLTIGFLYEWQQGALEWA